MATEAKLLVVQFLRWIADRPRTYEDVQSAWQSTCPLNCAWEDAISDGLVRIKRSSERPMGQSKVVLTPRGRAVLDENSG